MAQEGRDEKGKSPSNEKVIDRMLLKYPDTEVKIEIIDIKKEEERTIKELEALWQHQ